MKNLITIAFLLGVCSIFGLQISVSSTHAQTPDSLLLDDLESFAFFEGLTEGCALPCWENLELGVSDEGELLAVLERIICTVRY